MECAAGTTEEVWTIGRLLNWTTSFLSRHGIEDARLSGEVLLAHAAGCRRINLYTRFDQTVSADALARFREGVRRAAEHEPIAYLVGEKEFFSLALHVSRDVLIPRAETEQLVEVVIDHCRNRGLSQPLILDMGTGSGCIAVALLKQIPGARVVATDLSEAALETARRNAERHGVADRMTFVLADRLALPGDAVGALSVDVLVSNPPYIPAVSLPGVERAVREFEPRMALTDEGDGLSFYRSIAAEAAALIAPDGVVCVEVADGCAAAVAEAVESGGEFKRCGIWKDRVVGRERVVMFALRESRC